MPSVAVAIDSPYNPAARNQRAVLRDRQQRDAKHADRMRRRLARHGDAAAVLRTPDARRTCAVSDIDDARWIARMAGVALVETGTGAGRERDYDYETRVSRTGSGDGVFDEDGRPYGRRRLDDAAIRDNDAYLRSLAADADVTVRLDDEGSLDRRVLQVFARAWIGARGPAPMSPEQDA